MTTKETIDQKQQPKELGCFFSGLSVLLFFLGLYWFIIGEIIIETKGVYVQGISARITAGIWMVVCLFPLWRHIRTSRKRK
jgi:hypothetical protein